MTASKYRQLANALGPAVDLSQLMPYSIPVREESGDETVALYIVENASRRACYGGQTSPVSRIPGAVGRRIRQHLYEPAKARLWTGYWVIPMHEDVDGAVLHHLERALNARVGVPLRRRWSPR